MKIGVGVGVMILEEGNILLGLRNPDKEKASSELQGQGTWTMPGGKVDFHEKLIDAAIRELKEETDLDAKTLEVLCINDDFSETAHYVTVGFIATQYSGEVKAMEPEAILRWEWFSFDNLPENIYPPSKKCIEKYLTNKIYE